MNVITGMQKIRIGKDREARIAEQHGRCADEENRPARKIALHARGRQRQFMMCHEMSVETSASGVSSLWSECTATKSTKSTMACFLSCAFCAFCGKNRPEVNDYGDIDQRSSLRHSQSRQTTRLHCHRGPDTRTRHRRFHRDLQRCRWRTPAFFTLSRSRSDRAAS